MNLTRKILEGIQEVEFEINPEMQKHQGKKKGALGQVRAALKNNGWNVYNVVDLEAPEEGVRLSVWEHPNFTETIGIKWKDTRKVSGEIYAIELANNNLSVMTGDALSSKGLIQSMHPATPETVNKLTAEFKAEKD
ncbi:MAG: hypothetical protein KAJ19_27100, partial [Gammaproteobacteria bacterium]|nr:hypothetical protein [Gammaproteobacteria bacterium]